MGAVTAILYAAKNQYSVSMLILDSPYCNLQKVMKEIAESKTKIPSLILDAVISLLKRKIAETLKLDIFKYDIIEEIKKIK
jgi:hypothetical protein